jgi:hypothetical protein
MKEYREFLTMEETKIIDEKSNLLARNRKPENPVWKRQHIEIPINTTNCSLQKRGNQNRIQMQFAVHKEEFHLRNVGREVHRHMKSPPDLCWEILTQLVIQRRGAPGHGWARVTRGSRGRESCPI